MSLRGYKQLCLCMLSLLLTTAVLFAKTNMPAGSFLTKPVTSSAELAKLVREDKLVGLRYSKHFGMETAVLAKYFEENLTVSTLSKTATYTVYFIAKNGNIIAHKKQLKAGTKVFLNWNGEPIIDVKCGNPMTKSLPMKPVVQVDTPPIQITEPTVALLPVNPIVEVPSTPEITPTLEEEPTVMVAAEPPEELTPVTRVAPLQYLLVPSLLGAVGMLGGGGGGGTVVPEPSSLLVLGIGGAGMFITCRKRLASAIGRRSGTRNE